MKRLCPHCHNKMDIVAKMCPVCHAESEAGPVTKVAFTIHSLGMIVISLFFIVIVLIMMKACIFG